MTSDRSAWDRAAAAARTLCRTLDDDRAGRALLRRIRARDDEETVDFVPALRVEAFRTFIGPKGLELDLTDTRGPQRRLEFAAVAAAAIAQVRKDDERNPKVASRLGSQKAAGREAVLSEGRFLRLMRCETPDDMLPQAVRLVAILDRVAPVGDLGASLALWGPAVRKRWAFDYWSQPQPDAAEDAAEASV
jgi:CRISPR type I-E-associated protein CasB/Cse2